MKIAEALNSWLDDEAHLQLFRCCSSAQWVADMLKERPFQDDKHVFLAAIKNWLHLEEHDWLEAFKGHPKIGDVQSLKKKYGNTSDWAKGEQSGVARASDEVLEDLKKWNDEYEKKFGFIFIICASGKSATDMLSALRERYENDYDDELENAVKEQAKITALRLEKIV